MCASPCGALSPLPTAHKLECSSCEHPAHNNTDRAPPYQLPFLSTLRGWTLALLEILLRVLSLITTQQFVVPHLRPGHTRTRVGKRQSKSASPRTLIGTILLTAHFFMRRCAAKQHESLVSESLHRIDTCGATGGQICSKQSNCHHCHNTGN